MSKSSTSRRAARALRPFGLASTNRVYAQQAAALGRAELAVVSEEVLGSALSDIAQHTFRSVEYVTFTTPELSENGHAWLSNLAATFALFRLEEDGALRPLDLQRWDQLDSDLISIQKYVGKTNELFTKLLLNVTLAASAFANERRALAVLDPPCGRGTTLNQALMCGFHATGVEVDKKDFEAYCSFFQRWVKDKRLKHEAVLGHVKGHPKLDLNFGVDKARYQAGESLRLKYVSADTLAIAEVFQPRSFDLIVADAPYGVQHGSQGGAGTARKPLELLSSAIPVWRAALRPAGAIGIAWNNLVAKRGEIAQILAESGLTICDSANYCAFEHRIDASIVRELIVARAP